MPQEGVRKFMQNESIRGQRLESIVPNWRFHRQIRIKREFTRCFDGKVHQRVGRTTSSAGYFWFQRDVSAILSYMGEKYEEEAIVAGCRGHFAQSAGVVLEVDGPSHFARNVKATRSVKRI